MPDRSTSRDYDFWNSKPIRPATYLDKSVAHNALSQTALTQQPTPCEPRRVLNDLCVLPWSSQPLHYPHEPTTPIAYPTLATSATLDHNYATNHPRPPHIVNGPRATPTTSLTGTDKPPWQLQSSDHHLRDSSHLTATSAVPGSFRAAEQHAHRHGRDTHSLQLTTVSNTKPDRRPCPVQQLVRLPRRPITRTIPAS